MANYPIRLDPETKKHWEEASRQDGFSAIATWLKWLANKRIQEQGQKMITRTVQARKTRVDEALAKLASAIVLAVAEHGQPNSFSPKELHCYHGAPPATVIGRLMKDGNLPLVSPLHNLGWVGTMPQYDPETKRFYV